MKYMKSTKKFHPSSQSSVTFLDTEVAKDMLMVILKNKDLIKHWK